MTHNSLINYLKKKNIYVISPHFDDAVYSMGMLLYTLKNSGNVTVVNVFTRAHSGPYTIAAKKNFKTAGFSNAVDLYNSRLLEDKNALSAVNAKQINLDLPEALFRKKLNSKHIPSQSSFHSLSFGERVKMRVKNIIVKYIPEFEHVYPTFRWHIIKKVHPEDPAIQELKKKLMKIIPADAVVFSPTGIGNHADHIIVSHVCRKLFKNIFYYVDFPYYMQLNNSGKTPENYQKCNLAVNLKIKSKLIHLYPSQIPSCFPTGVIPDHKEIFFVPRQIL